MNFTQIGRVLICTTALLAALILPNTAARALPPTLPFECPAAKVGSNAQLPVMIDIDSAYVYWKPDWQSAQIGRVVKWQCLIAVGRNDNAEWILVTYGNGQAWLHSSMFQAQADLKTLPVTDQAQPSDLSLLKTPGVPQISPQMRALYKAAAKLGRNPRLFTTAGECRRMQLRAAALHGAVRLQRGASGTKQTIGRGRHKVRRFIQPHQHGHSRRLQHGLHTRPALGRPEEV